MSGAVPSRRFYALTAAVVAVPLALAGCGSSSKAGGSTTPSSGTSAAAKGCTPKVDTKLVVLADDKHSQNSDNIVPVVKTSLAKAPLTDALNAVSKALSQDALTTLNSDVSVSGKTSAAAATAFISKYNLDSGLSGGSGNITVGTQSFSEAATLGEVYKQVLTKAGYSVTVRKVGLRNLLEPALESGDVSVVPEYAASLTQFLLEKDKDTSQSASTEIDKTMAVLKPLALKHGFTALDPAAATDENAYAVTKASSTAYGLKTMSDVATKCGTTGIGFGAAANCPSNPFCAAAIKKVYGITIAFKSLDADGPLTRAAVKQGKVLIGEVFSSDPDLVQAG
jgi:osmoprotectant transport system substrate-binding protein